MKTYSKVMTLALIAILAVLCAPAVMAQQTVDPSGACGVPSNGQEINAQTGTFYCMPTKPGSTTGLWTKIDQALNGVRVAHAIYNFTTDGGAIATITPVLNATIPANAIIFGSILNSTTALTSGGSATIAVGTTAGSSSSSLKGATAYTSFTTDALVAGVPVFTVGSSVKMSAAGQISVTIATATITAGVLEVFVFYVPATNS